MEEGGRVRRKDMAKVESLFPPVRAPHSRTLQLSVILFLPMYLSLYISNTIHCYFLFSFMIQQRAWTGCLEWCGVCVGGMCGGGGGGGGVFGDRMFCVFCNH